MISVRFFVEAGVVSFELLKHCWFLAGPTAAGKTSTALHLSRQINAEIISMDSMAVYRGMDIGTAKASAEERSEIPHHLLDVVSPDQDFTVNQFVTSAQEVVKDIVARGCVPLFA